MSQAKISVLLVDDDEPIRDALGRSLRAAGYFVDCGKDGEVGLRMFKEGSWDLVITDLIMPGMEGDQLAEEIRKISPHMPMILVTGLLKSGARVELFDEVLRKPLFPSELLAAAERVLRKAAIRRASSR